MTPQYAKACVSLAALHGHPDCVDVIQSFLRAYHEQHLLQTQTPTAFQATPKRMVL